MREFRHSLHTVFECLYLELGAEHEEKLESALTLGRELRFW